MIVKEFDNRNEAKIVKLPKSRTNKRIYNIQILDGSGSMFYGTNKYDVAYAATREDVADIKEELLDYPTMKVIYGLFEFSGVNHSWIVHPNNVENVKIPRQKRHSGGGTPLYESIIHVVTKIRSLKRKGDHCLLKIFTDGQDTSANNSLRMQCSALLRDVQEYDNFTVTFVGTAYDTKFVQDNLNVDASNTLVHTNTAESVDVSFNVSKLSNRSYMGNVNEGKDVRYGYFDKTTN
jgi:hypothetical protein